MKFDGLLKMEADDVPTPFAGTFDDDPSVWTLNEDGRLHGWLYPDDGGLVDGVPMRWGVSVKGDLDRLIQAIEDAKREGTNPITVMLRRGWRSPARGRHFAFALDVGALHLTAYPFEAYVIDLTEAEMQAQGLTTSEWLNAEAVEAFKTFEDRLRTSGNGGDHAQG